jgi:hypothetical protein
MWDAAQFIDDGHTTSGCNDLLGSWKDRPCNTHAYLRVREVDGVFNSLVLDMTVCCRSNDIVLGAYGANAVHFSFLQEYLAAMIGVHVGTYYQISNNYHVYEAEIKRLESRRLRSPEHRDLTLVESLSSHQIYPVKNSVPLVSDPIEFDRELEMVVRTYEKTVSLFDDLVAQSSRVIKMEGLSNPFLSGTLLPMMMTHLCWKLGEMKSAAAYVAAVEDDAWREAAKTWIERRAK